MSLPRFSPGWIAGAGRCFEVAYRTGEAGADTLWPFQAVGICLILSRL